MLRNAEIGFAQTPRGLSDPASGLINQKRDHPKKEVEEALRYAEAHGWRVSVGGSHAWGKIYCPYDDEACRCGEFCIASIWSTPKNAVNEARKIRRVVDKCTARKAQGSAAGDEGER